ncbi:transmembrane protein 126 isoform X2 [Rhynchophorus ferrugineus]|uniref:transmembrane protein 126 isoform X2 n=1 Tax=Rhynchophorus ferrugineus TaxID=354439 RepID=UPI003FCD4776
MAVNRAKYNEIPKGAKIIGENEALQFQTDLIQRWPNKSDTFAVRYGMYFLYGATMISGIIITRHFRKKFLLYNYGKFMSLIPITIIPATTVRFKRCGITKKCLPNMFRAPICSFSDIYRNCISCNIGTNGMCLVVPIFWHLQHTKHTQRA